MKKKVQAAVLISIVITTILGIILVAVLGYFGFRKGGWFNKDDKKTEKPTSANGVYVGFSVLLCVGRRC